MPKEAMRIDKNYYITINAQIPLEEIFCEVGIIDIVLSKEKGIVEKLKTN